MTTPCTIFRDLLEDALVGKPDPSRLTDLSFNEHLFACSSCRDLLQAEEALEILLASWPRPVLPPEMSARLIERLRESRRLEELLDLSLPPSIPEGLAGRVLKAVAPERAGDPEARLDAWLDLAGKVEVPKGLSDRVLAGLRQPANDQVTPFRSTRLRLVRARRAAAILLASLSIAVLWRASSNEGDTDIPGGLELAMAVPSEELLSALPVLENWDVLFGEDDLDLATGMDFSSEDEALLDFPYLAALDRDEESGR